MSEVIKFQFPKIRKYFDETFTLFFSDPPDSDFQRGYLSAVICLYKEAYQYGDACDARLPVLEKMCEANDANHQ